MGIMAAFCTIVFVIVWLFQVVLLDNFYRNIKTKALYATSSQIVDAIENVRMDLSMKEEFTTQLKSMSMESDACALIRNISNGYEVRMTNSSFCPIQNINSMNAQGLYQIAKDNGGKWSSFLPNGIDVAQLNRADAFDMKQSQTFISIENTVDSVGNEITVIMATVIRPVNVFRDVLVKQLWNVLAIIGLCSVLLSYILAKLIAKPISKINDEAKNLAMGNYQVEFNGKGYREIEELSNTLNYAAHELNKVESLRQELIANVSHDLRTPLTMISGYGEVMRDIPGENTPENVQIIIDEANRLSSMVNNLLDISKLQANTEELNLETINLTKLLEDIMNRYQKMLDMEFVFEKDAEYDVYVDSVRMQQVIYNLLNNAVNYSNESKKIVVKQSLVNDMVRVDIIDFGIGVKKEDLPYIWNRYYKVDKNHQMSVAGSGLGLSIVKTILDKHQAKYGVISEFGKGSDFYFMLPVVKE